MVPPTCPSRKNSGGQQEEGHGEVNLLQQELLLDALLCKIRADQRKFDCLFFCFNLDDALMLLCHALNIECGILSQLTKQLQ